MKHVYVIIFLFVSLTAQCQNWQWAKQVGSNILQSYDYAEVITDGSNSYLVGRYSGSLYLQTDTLHCNGNNGMYVIKYDNSGNEIWAKGFGGDNLNSNSYDEINGAYNPVDNSIYLSGRFYGLMPLDMVDTLGAGGYSDIFLIKMDLNGNFNWGKQIVTDLAEDMSYVFIQPDGNIFLEGTVGDSATFGSIRIPAGGFFARFDTNGNCNWARHEFDGIGSKLSIAFLGSDLVFGGSSTSMLTTFDTISLSILPNNSYGLISRMDSVGKVKWYKSVGLSGLSSVSALTVDNFGNVIVAGGFHDSIAFDGLTLYNSGEDVFLAKYDSIGNFVWGKNINSTNGNIGVGKLKTSYDGSFYLTGGFSGSKNFGNINVATSNILDMYLARYNSSGDCLGVRNFGYANGNSVVVDNTGNPICAGSFQNTVSIGNNTFTSHGWFDVFIAKCGAITGLGGDNHRVNNNLLIYANPMEGKCTISVPDELLNEKHLVLSIFDSNGKLIQQRELERFEGKVRLNLEAEAKGVYTAVLSSGSKSYSGKIVFE